VFFFIVTLLYLPPAGPEVRTLRIGTLHYPIVGHALPPVAPVKRRREAAMERWPERLFLHLLEDR
jgi:hypothetical protein